MSEADMETRKVPRNCTAPPSTTTTSNHSGPPERLIDVRTMEMKSMASIGRKPYAILSHTRGTEEVLLRDWHTVKDERHPGHQKILAACRQARRDNLNYLCFDTCCIDQTNSAELNRAINSMYNWYRNSTICYAHLGDVRVRKSLDGMQRPWVSYEELADARWFQRGWTLQELLAPDNVQFFDADWAPIGSLRSLEEWVAEITGIDERALSKKWPVKCFSTAQKFSWASRRVTTIDEDKAYCLVGLFSVSLAPEYGITGRRAFHLLQEAIIRQSCELDESIFVWDTDDDSRQDELFANSPKDFQNGGDIEYDFDQRVPSSFVWSGGRLHGDFRLLRSDPRLDKWDGCVALLNCKLRDQDEKQLGLCLKPVETGHNSRRHRSRTGPTYAVNPRPRRNRSCRTVLIDQLRTIDTFPYRISVVTSVLKTRHDYPLGTMSAHLRRVESLIQLGEGDHGSRPQSRLSENVLWSRAFRNDQHTAVSGYDTTSDVPARSAPPGFKKRRISRPLDESESAAFAAFEIHARECPDCYNPGEVLLAGGELCRTGRSLGNSVGSYAFYRKGKIVGREGSDTLQIFLELPQYYQQVWDYLST